MTTSKPLNEFQLLLVSSVETFLTLSKIDEIKLIIIFKDKMHYFNQVYCCYYCIILHIYRYIFKKKGKLYKTPIRQTENFSLGNIYLKYLTLCKDKKDHR